MQCYLWRLLSTFSVNFGKDLFPELKMDKVGPEEIHKNDYSIPLLTLKQGYLLMCHVGTHLVTAI